MMTLLKSEDSSRDNRVADRRIVFIVDRDPTTSAPSYTLTSRLNALPVGFA